nr:YqgE/AlgH family protein [uncultured Moellerella sp.]
MHLKNHFLIAMPTLTDPYFSRSVVYLCEHNEYGAMGLVINKPIEDFSVTNMLHKLEINTQDRDDSIILNSPVIAGGPVAEEHGFILHTPIVGFTSSLQVSDEIMVTTSKDILDILGSSQQSMKALVTLGCSRWERGQLESEIMENSWLTVPANASLLFETPLEARWASAAALLNINIHTISLQAGHA